MILVADEGVDRQVVERLRSDGHQVHYAAEFAPGTSDDLLLRRATDQDAILLTTDRDFGELVLRLRRLNSGVVLVRLAGISPEGRAEIVSGVFRDRADELPLAFTVISPGMVRIRRLG